MRIITLRNVLVSALLTGAPVVAHAQPISAQASYDNGVVDVSASIGGEPIDSVDVFYDQLSPYGMWIDDPDLGQVFAPANGDFVPYSDGHWEDSDVGFVWVSDQPFEWATAHYGRWAFSQTFGRWVWLPDTTWGPAWVEWREADDDFGWAPMAPEGIEVAGYEPPVEAWHYAPARHLFDRDVRRYYEPRARVTEIHRQARPVERYEQVGGARVVAGPSPDVLRQHKVEARPQKVDMRAAGRWTRPQVQAAVKHAQDNRAAVEQKNRQRVERDPMLQKVQAKPAQAPASGPQKQPARPVERAQPAQPERTQPTPPAQKAPTPPAQREPQTRAPQTREPTTRAPQQREPQPPRAEPTPPAPREPTPRAPQQREPAPPQMKEQRTPPAHPAPQRGEPQPPRAAPTPPARPAPQQRAPQPPREPAPPQVKEQRTPPARPAPQQRAPSPQPAPHAQPNPPSRPNPATRRDEPQPERKKHDQ